MQVRSVLALDVGTKRIGVAIAREDVRIARPLMTVLNDDSLWEQLKTTVVAEAVSVIVVGLPRGLDGQETAQTEYVRDFVGELEHQIDLPIHLQDEAATSVKAEGELRSRGKPYEKSDIDSLAATYILEDYLQETASV